MNSTGAERKRSLVGVIAAMALVNLVYGITFPLLALVLDAQGVSETLIGLNTITQAAAVPIVAPLIPKLMRYFSAVRLMQTGALVLAVLFILAGVYQDLVFWFPLRFMIGAMTAVIWAASEAMINELVEDQWRGRVIGVYTAAGAAGFALGPLLLIATGSQGLLPFVCTSVLTLLAALPLFRVSRMAPPEADDEQQGLLKIFMLVPAVMLANVVYAASVESISTFFPLFGRALGVGEDHSLALMTIIGVGGMVLIMPISWLADKLNRRFLLMAVMILTMAGLLLMPVMVALDGWSAVFVFLFGGCSGMIYALGLVLIGEQFKGAQLAGATTAYTACWGIGSVIGPMLVGAGMDRFGAQYMSLVIFLIFLIYLPMLLVSWFRSSGHRIWRETHTAGGTH